jgi:hypothetical protein
MKTRFMTILLSFILLFFLPMFVHASNNGLKLLKFFEYEHIPPQPLLPVYVKITGGFEPGIGISVGAVREIHGTVLVFHKGGGNAYRLKKKLPIFRGDTLITEAGGRVTLLMEDKSALTLTSRSKLLIDKSFGHFDTKTNIRDTKLQLLFGRMRVIVSKIIGKSDYAITTPTAVAGVRGTDFALSVGPVFKPNYAAGGDKLIPLQMTAIVTGENNSTVEFNGTEVNPIIVGSLSVAAAMSGRPADKAVHIGPSALNSLKRNAPELDRILSVKYLYNCGIYRRRMHYQLQPPISPVRPH